MKSRSIVLLLLFSAFASHWACSNSSSEEREAVQQNLEETGEAMQDVLQKEKKDLSKDLSEARDRLDARVKALEDKLAKAQTTAKAEIEA